MGGTLMGMSLTERDRRYSAIRELMKKDNLNCLVIASRDTFSTRGNTRYVTNHGNNFGEEIVMFPLNGNPSIIASTIRGPAIQRGGWVQDFLPVANISERVQTLKRELTRFDKGDRIGIVGMEYISVPVYLAVMEQYPNRVVDAIEIFNQLRNTKSHEEIEKMRVSTWIADKAFLTIRDMLRPGISDYELYGEAQGLIHKMGSEYSMQLMPGYPYGKVMEGNDILTFEFTPTCEGYYAQLLVSIPVSEYPRHVQKFIHIWEEALSFGVENLRPGKKVSEVHRAVSDVIQKRGGSHIAHRFGHSIGLDAIDSWEVVPGEDTELKPGMTLAFHPGIVLEPGSARFDGGYTYLITDTGAEKLNRVDFLSLE
jgi:Xaa-Pro aminopeptidase